MSFWRRKNLNSCQKKTCKPKRDSSLRSAAFRMTEEFLLRFFSNDDECHSDEGRISRIVRKRLVNQKGILHSAPFRMTEEFLLRFVRNDDACHSDEGRISTIVRKRLVNQKEILHSAPLRSEWQWNFCSVSLGMTTHVILTKEESQQLSEKDL